MTNKPLTYKDAGVDIDAGRDVQRRCLEEAGVCFCFAIHHHPATRHVMPVRLALGGDTVQLTAITKDVGDAAEEIDASYDGAEMTVAFNPDYLASGIDAVEGDEVTLSTMDPMKPAVLRGVGHDDYLYLLMPVRVP